MCINIAVAKPLPKQLRRKKEMCIKVYKKAVTQPLKKSSPKTAVLSSEGYEWHGSKTKLENLQRRLGNRSHRTQQQIKKHPQCFGWHTLASKVCRKHPEQSCPCSNSKSPTAFSEALNEAWSCCCRLSFGSARFGLAPWWRWRLRGRGWLPELPGRFRT